MAACGNSFRMAARNSAGSGGETGRATQTSEAGATGRLKRAARRRNSGSRNTRSTPGAGPSATARSGAIDCRPGKAPARSRIRMRSEPGLMARQAETANGIWMTSDFSPGWAGAWDVGILALLFVTGLWLLRTQNGLMGMALAAVLLLTIGIDYKVHGTWKRFN